MLKNSNKFEFIKNICFLCEYFNTIIEDPENIFNGIFQVVMLQNTLSLASGQNSTLALFIRSH